MKSLIPKEQIIVGYDNEIEMINHAVDQNLALLLIGETGVGKTSLIRHLAYKNKRPLRRVNLNGQTTVDEFVGKTLLNREGTFWQDGVLIDAMKKGYWLVLDEINAALPEILFVLHSLLDDDKYIVLSEKDGEVITPHENFRIFATMNPSGRYAGTKDLNKAFLSRFPMVIQIDFPNEEQEKGILSLYTKLDKDQIFSLVKVANQLREAYKKDDIEYVCSTRDLINCGLLTPKFGIRKAIELSIGAKVVDADKAAVDTTVSLYFGKTGESLAKDKQETLEALNDRLLKTIHYIAADAVKISNNTAKNIDYINHYLELPEDEVKEKSLILQKELFDNFLPKTFNDIHRIIHTIKNLELNDTEEAKDLYKKTRTADEEIHQLAKINITKLKKISSKSLAGMTGI